MKIHRRGLLSSFLRQKRIDATMTQNELAKLLGYRPQFITNWERGASSPPAHIMPKLTAALNIREEELLEILCQESMEYWQDILGMKRARVVCSRVPAKKKSSG